MIPLVHRPLVAWVVVNLTDTDYEYTTNKELYGAKPNLNTERLIGYCDCGYTWPVIPAGFAYHIVPIDRQCCPRCGQPAVRWETHK